MTNQETKSVSTSTPWNTWEVITAATQEIELVDLSLTAASIAVYRPQPPWLITKLKINNEIIRATLSYVPANES